MRVLHVTTSLSFGGAEGQLVELVQRTRHNADVVGMYGFGSTGQYLRARGTRVFHLNAPNRYDVRVLFRLTKLMRRGGYDVVHAHLFRPAIYARPAARLAGVPVVVTTEHSLGSREIEDRRLTFGIRLLYLATEQLSDKTVAVSPWVRKLLTEWGVPTHKTVVIPNGLDPFTFGFSVGSRTTTRAALGIPEDATVIGTVGRLVRRKQQALVIRAAAKVIREGAWLLIVGDGPERVYLERLASHLGVGNRVLFTGESHDIPATLAAMDVFASPALEETFGLAPLEALISGLPVLVTHCPALTGMQPPRVWWVRDEIDNLEGAMRDALRNRPARDLPPEGPYRSYDIRHIVRQVDNLYEDLYATRGGRLGPCQHRRPVRPTCDEQ
jgi:glycosyltransferase involved in cell wall biosynthesis